MLPPGYEEPSIGASPPGGDLYFPAAAGLQNPGQVYFGGGRSASTGAQSDDAAPPDLYYSDGYTGQGEPIKLASNSSRGHASEVFNFHGSPAPWVLLGILLVAGILHLSAEGKFGLRGGV